MREAMVGEIEYLDDFEVKVSKYHPENVVTVKSGRVQVRDVKRSTGSLAMRDLNSLGVGNPGNVSEILGRATSAKINSIGLDRIRRSVQAVHEELNQVLSSEEVVDLRRTHFRVPVVGTALDSIAGLKSKVSFAYSKDISGGIEVKVGVLGAKLAATYKISDSWFISASAGEAFLGYLLIPIYEQDVLIRYKGGKEKFPLTRYLPVIEDDPIVPKEELGFFIDEVKPNDIAHWVAKSRKSIRARGSKLSGSKSEVLKLSLETSIEKSFGDKENRKLGANFTLSGSVGVSAEYEAPSGDYILKWYRRPVGVSIDSK
ncbi:MAG: hypothetical protein HKN43_06570 [Rhodothermales bacterium]|nr:hypothetical protein [Rhodothermales bacterium]